MPNILLIPGRWNDDAPTTPPANWNGSLYDFTGDNGPANRIFATAASGDTVAFTLNNLATSNCPIIPNGLQVMVNGIQVYSYDLTKVGTSTFASAALSNGDAIEIVANTQFVSAYNVDFTITPTAQPVAPNETLTITENSDPTTLTPVITENGAPVTPSSLTVLTQPANGSAVVVGTALAYTPDPGFHGIDSFTFKATVSGTDSNVATVTASVYALAADDLGRVTRSFVSGYTASRAETHRVRRFSKRTVTANFNGALAKGRTITHVRWDCTSPWAIFMENARIIAGQRQVAVDVSFNFAGWGGLLVTVTLDNGELFNQEFFYTVLDRPLYPGAVYNSANGPYVLESDV